MRTEIARAAPLEFQVTAPLLPRSVASALRDSSFTTMPWDARQALGEVAGNGQDYALRWLAIEHRRSLTPASQDWIEDRLTRLSLAFNHMRRTADEQTAWLIECARLLADLPPDILGTAMDEAIKRKPDGFLPSVGEIRAVADPIHLDRKREASRLEAMAALLDQADGTRLAPVVGPSEEERLDPGEVEEANRLMKRVGARTRYRPDGTHYRLEIGDPDPAEPTDGAGDE